MKYYVLRVCSPEAGKVVAHFHTEQEARAYCNQWGPAYYVVCKAQ